MNSELAQLAIAIKSKELFVVMMKDDSGNPTLLVDPGMNRPWSSKNKKLADFHAKNCNGEARTWRDAWDILIKANPLFEKELFDRIKARSVDKDIIVPKKHDQRN